MILFVKLKGVYAYFEISLSKEKQYMCIALLEFIVPLK
jgi:hypothetical protein